jgi:hypothetical protein
MPIQNLTRTRARQAGKTMSQYSPSPMALLNKIMPNAASNVAGLSQISNYVPGLNQQIGSVIFDTLSGKKPSNFPGLNAVDGVLGTDNFALPEEYTVIITSKKVGRVPAILQDKMQFRITSDWQPVVSPSDMKGANIFLQAVSGGRMSAVASITSRRIWMGTSPVNISLTLRFEAISNAKTQVVIPCMNLKKIAAPAKGKTEFTMGIVGGTIPLLAPPGPHPFALPEGDIDAEAKVSRSEVSKAKQVAQDLQKFMMEGQDTISVSIGKLWHFKSVIVKEVEVTFDNKYTSEGDPISATAQLLFETYEILTKEDIEEVYQGAKS